MDPTPGTEDGQSIYSRGQQLVTMLIEQIKMGRLNVMVVTSSTWLTLTSVHQKLIILWLCWSQVIHSSAPSTTFVGSHSLGMPRVRERGRARQGRGSTWQGGAKLEVLAPIVNNLAEAATDLTVEGVAESRDPMQPAEQPVKEDTLIRGCKVKWIKEMDAALGEFKVQYETKRKASTDENIVCPEEFGKTSREDCTVPTEYRLAEEHLQLSFELRGEVADLKFKMELTDDKLSLLLDLCTHLSAQQTA